MNGGALPELGSQLGYWTRVSSMFVTTRAKKRCTFGYSREDIPHALFVNNEILGVSVFLHIGAFIV